MTRLLLVERPADRARRSSRHSSLSEARMVFERLFTGELPRFRRRLAWALEQRASVVTGPARRLSHFSRRGTSAVVQSFRLAWRAVSGYSWLRRGPCVRQVGGPGMAILEVHGLVKSYKG